MALRIPSRIRHLLRNLLRRAEVEREMDEEMRSTLEMMAAEGVARGVPPAEARRQAQMELGGLGRFREEIRDVRAGARIEGAWRQVRSAARTLRRAPGFTAVAVVTLALGIGANTAIFTVVNAVLLQPLPYVDPDRLVVISSANPARGWTDMPIPTGVYETLTRESRTLTQVAALTPHRFDLTSGDEPVQIAGARAAAGLFPLLGVEPLLGRWFLPEEDQLLVPDAAVIGHRLWQATFGGDPDVLGRTVTLSDRPYTIVGVMPAGFRFPERESEIWVPLGHDPERSAWGDWFLTGVGRLGPDVSLARAQSEVDALAEGLSDRLPFGAGWAFPLESMKEGLVEEVRPALLILSAAVGLVLLIACFNVAGLLLARAGGRGRELAVRAALGASRSRLVTQLLTENLLLSLTGGLLALLVVRGFLGGLLASLPQGFPRTDAIRVDLFVLLFALVAALASTLASGLLPALQSTRIDLVEAIKGAGGTAGGSGRTRRWLVAGELALSVILLVGAGLLVRSFDRLTDVEPGFDGDHAISLRVSLPQDRYAEPAAQAEFVRSVTEHIRGLPQVLSVGAASGMPTRTVGSMDDSVIIETADGEKVDIARSLAFEIVSPGYLETLGIPLREGRLLDPRDREGAPPVVLVNESLARLFAGGSAVGRRLLDSNDETWLTIVGVVGDVKQFGLDQETPLLVYRPFDQQPRRTFNLAVQTHGPPTARVADLKAAIWSVDPTLPVTRIETLDQVLSASVAPHRFTTYLMTLFGALALVLAVVGVYAVVSQAVSQRTQEVGIRMALGARAASVVGLVLRQGLGTALVGLAAGLAGAGALSRYLESLLFGISVSDPLSFTASAFLMLAAAALACLIPAHRATRIDPLTAIRYE